MIRLRPTCSRYFLLCFLIGVTVSRPLQAADTPSVFQREIAPLLRAHCLKCHSGANPKNGLDLTQRDGMLKGGLQGAAVTPSKANDSLLFQYVLDKKMPPKQPLDTAEIEALRRWIDAGAQWDRPRLAPPENNRAGLDW